MTQPKTPWIPMREVTLCPWEPELVRAETYNRRATNLNSIYRFSRRQMRDYMHMMKQFGYTGVQLIDSCYSWNFYGTPEAFHEKLIDMAEAARAEGLHVTLWVWAAFFGGHGWYDPDVAEHKYPAAGHTAFTDPAIRGYFEKYYDLYAELAPHVDLLIGHFFDPGDLTDYNDIIAYMHLLVEKFRAKNENIKFAVDTWGTPDDFPDAVIRSGMDVFMFMDQPNPNVWKKEERYAFRRDIAAKGGRLGMWGWYTCEYETDQLASMYVNGHVLKDVYSRVKRDTDGLLSCTYWSEMDAYHLNNIFSMYCAAGLLIDPERDPDELLREAVEGIWQGEAADAMYFALKTIEDIRSGDRWETYWWTEDEFRWGTGDNAADLARIEKAYALIEPLTKDKTAVSASFSLPVAPWVLARLILPHLEQMRRFAVFKEDLAALEARWEAGAFITPDALREALRKIIRIIPDFNTWVGTFHQIESRQQDRMIRGFCKKHEIPVPEDPIRFELLRSRLLGRMELSQKGRREPVLITAEGGYAYCGEEAMAVVHSLVRDGLLIPTGDGRYYLAEWDNFMYHFNVN